ncbi:hypothetical protein CJ178_13460 [Rhodococcus sp. ACPA4]|uniref:hypothetical protein n=1 Tax=Rhodococcus sp. ACPA4 TaxID=2028571 RepID=UPI000BB136CE|nr:hypothetical protein [Rhodococcus sp. ACPA4]PBC42464.1 hypothetical protein CJ178_13460 [Rhodococcus sp. ACPA4]
MGDRIPKPRHLVYNYVRNERFTLLPGLVEIDPIDHDMTEDLRERIERRHQARQAYAFVPHEALSLPATRAP